MSWFKKILGKKDEWDVTLENRFYQDIIDKSGCLMLSDNYNTIKAAELIWDIQIKEGNTPCYIRYNCNQPDHILCDDCRRNCNCKLCCWHWGCKQAIIAEIRGKVK